MSDPKRVYTKLEQLSLRLALGDSSSRSAIHRPQRHRLTHSTSTNSRTITLVIVASPALRSICSVRPPGMERLSLLTTYTKPSSSSLAGFCAPEELHYTRQVLGCPGPSTTRRTIRRRSQRTHQPLLSPPYSPRNCSTRETLDARAAQRLVSSNTLMQNARQQNSEPHQLRTSPSVTTMSKNISRRADRMTNTPYHNFSPSPQHRPVLGVRHSTHATSAENVRSATLLQASESFGPRASPVQDPSLSRILDMPQSENAALRAQIADLTKQLTLFLSRVPAASPGPKHRDSQPSATEAAPPAHNAAPETEAPNKRPRVSYADKLKSSFPNAQPSSFWRNKSHSRPHHSSQETPYRRPPPACLCWRILRKPIREAKQNLMTWALTHALAQSLTSSSLRLHLRASHTPDYEIDCPNLRILKNFDAAKAADPKDLQRSSLPWSIATPSASTLSLAAKVHLQRSATSHRLFLRNPPVTTKMRFRCQLPQLKLTSLMPNPPKKLMLMSLTVPIETNTSPVPAETVNPQSTGPARNKL
ncbi:hypothetical protein DSO57_1034853 [Entomophthora muscae]|uniref:Uncharacterized protein n=1 Tax=Entomophthora muscae TaxID=34485 RepID=A0ACC2TXK5_9FUNG|nr:hypothetical protein DSO57_1034853 [Entomophthora muscae]